MRIKRVSRNPSSIPFSPVGKLLMVQKRDFCKRMTARKDLPRYATKQSHLQRRLTHTSPLRIGYMQQKAWCADRNAVSYHYNASGEDDGHRDYTQGLQFFCVSTHLRWNIHEIICPYPLHEMICCVKLYSHHVILIHSYYHARTSS